MKLFAILGHAKPASDRLPDLIREFQDIRGVRVIRLQGPVGKENGAQADAADKAAAESEGGFSRPLLFDFKETTHSDSVTVAYMVRALRRRISAHAQVGIINAPQQLVAELEMAKLDAMFHVFTSEEQALAELSKLSQ
jgi:anti-anti-sigma regulatory factor